ncbi:hypothetical protein FQZ97_1131620 [compost metagenome]
MFDRPTRSSSCAALAFASARFTPSTRMGDSMMFSSTERCGKRLKLWNTKPMRLRSLLSAALLMGAWMSWPSNSNRPDFTSSRRLTVRISVDLPEPEGPQTTTTSPLLTSALTSASAW